MNRTLAQASIVALLLATAACGTNSYNVVSTPQGQVTTRESANILPASTPARIPIVRGRPDRAFQKVANISVTVSKNSAFDGGPTRASVDRQLQVEAAKLNADAVIDVAYGPPRRSMLTWTKMDATGTAIRYTN
jgi:hypothetical protein